MNGMEWIGEMGWGGMRWDRMNGMDGQMGLMGWNKVG